MPNHPMLSGDRFRLGTFSTNCSSGMTPTKAPERWVNSWDNNLKLAQMLDEAGIDFMLPIARWIGYGGETDFHGGVLETMTWAAGLLAAIELVIENADDLGLAIELYRNDGYGFADMMIAAAARRAGARELVTFDRKAARLRGVRLLTA